MIETIYRNGYQFKIDRENPRRRFGGGGSPKAPRPTQRAVTAQPVTATLSETEDRNKKLAAALLTQNWNKPPQLGVTGLQNKNNLLGL